MEPSLNMDLEILRPRIDALVDKIKEGIKEGNEIKVLVYSSALRLELRLLQANMQKKY